MPKGRIFKPEKEIYVDKTSGLEIIRLTKGPWLDINRYFVTYSWTPDEKYIIFCSTRDGEILQLYRIDKDGEIVQLTEGPQVKAYSACISKDGTEVYFPDGNQIKSVNIETLEEKTLYEFDFIPSDFSPFTLSPDGNWLSVDFKVPGRREWRLGYLDIEKKNLNIVYATDIIIDHSMFCPTDRNWILYAHECPVDSLTREYLRVDQRMWLIKSDGSQIYPLYLQKIEEWITHEIWSPDGKGVYFINYPQGICYVNKDNSGYKLVAKGPYWHPSIHPNNKYLTADTQKGEVYVISIETDEKLLITSGIRLYPSNYHKHPHPSFSPSGNYIIYWSNYFGTDDIHIAYVGEFCK